MKILYLMTARGGSKGVPRKNLRRIDGMSLLAIKAGGARRARSCDEVFLSTEDSEIAEEARACGIDVPFVRPAELASDTASSTDVISHALDHFEAIGKQADAIMLLEPSSPFTRGVDYDAAVELMSTRKADAVIGMRRMEVNSRLVGPIAEDGTFAEIIRNLAKMRASPGRQEFRPEFTMNGALYLFRWDYFRAHRNIYHDEKTVLGLPMPPEVSLEIDEPNDLSFAEYLVSSGRIRLDDYR